MKYFYIILAVVLTVPQISADGSTASASSVFRGQFDVDVVTVYATVLDREGNPVSGLTASDFIVKEDGEKRPINFFEAVTPLTLAPAAAGSSTDQAMPERSQDTVVLAFDCSRLEKRSRRRVVKSFASLVDELTSMGLKVMVVMVNVSTEIAQAPTSDPAPLHLALAGVDESPSGGDALKAERRFIMLDIASGGMTPSAVRAIAQQLMQRITNLRERERQHTYRSLEQLANLVQGLAGRAGRTSLVWVTQDMSLRPVTAVYRRYYNRFESIIGTLSPPEMWSTESELLRYFQQLLGLAQAAGVTVHVIDASERDREFPDSAVRGPDLESATTSSNSSFGYDFSEIYDSIDGAQYLGYGTGGGFYGNTRDFAPFTVELAAAVGTYYVLGFERPSKDDNTLSAVHIEVLRPGLRVRHPEKILDRPPEQELVDAAVSALLFGGSNNQLRSSLLVDAPSDDGKGVLTWPVELLIPVASLLTDDNGRADVAVALCVIHSDGTMTAPFTTRLALHLTPEAGSDAVGSALLNIQTREHAERLAVSVLDQRSGTQSTITVSLEVPKD